MSQDALKQFLDKLRSEPALQREITGLLEQSDDPGALSVSEFAALAARHGFSISESDLTGLGNDWELGMEELDAVSGGAEQQFYTVELVNATLSDLSGALSRTLPSFKLRR